MVVIRVSADTKEQLDLIRVKHDRWRKGSYDKILRHILTVYGNAQEILDASRG